MDKYKIKDYWCFGCGLVCNTSFVCPICGTNDYGVIDLDLSKEPKRDLLMNLYQQGTLFVHRENGKLALRDKSVGRVLDKLKVKNE